MLRVCLGGLLACSSTLGVVSGFFSFVSFLTLFCVYCLMFMLMLVVLFWFDFRLWGCWAGYCLRLLLVLLIFW